MWGALASTRGRRFNNGTGKTLQVRKRPPQYPNSKNEWPSLLLVFGMLAGGWLWECRWLTFGDFPETVRCCWAESVIQVPSSLHTPCIPEAGVSSEWVLYLTVAQGKLFTNYRSPSKVEPASTLRAHCRLGYSSYISRVFCGSPDCSPCYLD